MQDLLEYLGKALVAHPESFSVETKSDDEADQYLLTVHEEDYGQIIGRQGRTARALRVLAKAGSARHGRRSAVEILE